MKDFRKKPWKLVRRLCMPVALLLCFHTHITHADNLGVKGSVYHIVEPDMLRGIQEKLQAMQKSGELERQKQLVITRSIQHILRPTPVQGVTDLQKGQTPLQHTFNPTLVVNKDITNSNGDLIAKKGTQVNPLNTMHFDETLLFINGDNANQIHWAKRMEKKTHTQYQRFKIILIKGNINDASKALHHRVYFDQHGTLCKHFSIKYTPTMVFQPKVKGVYVPEIRVKEIQID